MRKLLLTLALCLPALSSQAAVTQLNLLSFPGVKGNGANDDYAGITNAFAIVRANQYALYAPAAKYAVSKAVTIPDRFRLYGDPVDTTYKSVSGGPKGTIFMALGNNTVFQSPRLTYPNDNINYWISHVDMRDLYIMGQGTQASASNSSIGLDMTGIYDSNFERIHVEGFGTGMLFKNCAEITIDWPMTQNNYNGLIVTRSPANGGVVYDALVRVNNGFFLNDVMELTLDNPRYFMMNGGEIINNLPLNLIPKVAIKNGRDDVEVHLFGIAALENQAAVELINIDTNGLGILTVSHSNLSIDQNKPVVRSLGNVSRITVEHNQLQRAVTTTHTPLVVLERVYNSADANGFLRANNVTVQFNDPDWFDNLVQNNQANARPENDYVPEGFIPLNPFDSTGSAGMDGIISVAGNYAFNAASLCGIARVYWQTNDFTNNVYTLNISTNMSRGWDELYATAVFAGTNSPILNVQGWGTQGVGWNRTGQGMIGSYTNASTGIVFNKWGWHITMLDPAYAQQGLSQVQLFGVYGTDGGTKANYGLERFQVYANRAKNPYGPRIATHAAIPSTGLEGFHAPGVWPDYYANDFTLTANPVGWKCVSAGNPGVWVPVNGYTLPDIFGTLTPGNNIPANYWRGYGFSTGWPLSAGTIYNASSTDQYFVMNGYLGGGTKAAPTFFASGSGANFIRTRTSGAANDAVFEVGFIQNGSGSPGTTSLAIAPSGNVTLPFNLNVSGAITTPLFQPTAVETLSITSTNGLTIIQGTTAPTAASLGAGKGRLWSSNSVPPTVYWTSTADGASATTYKVAGP